MISKALPLSRLGILPMAASLQAVRGGSGESLRLTVTDGCTASMWARDEEDYRPGWGICRTVERCERRAQARQTQDPSERD